MATFNTGDFVKVLPPFDETFGGVYTVVAIVNSPDSSVTYMLDQDAGGFDAIYLEAV